MDFKNKKIIDKLREALSNVDIKTYLYALGVLAVLIIILINVSDPKKYGSLKKDGKYYINIENIKDGYGLNDAANTDLNADIDYANNNDNNLTKDLTTSLTLTNLFLNQNGLSDKNMRGEILANIILQYQKQALGKTYTNNDLNIIREDDENSMLAYSEDLENAISKYSSNIESLPNININTPSNEVTEEELLNVKGSVTANIMRLININNNFINDLISIPATADGASYQLNLINDINAENVYLKSLAYIDTDPMKYILMGGDNFIDKFQIKISSDLAGFNTYFKNQ